MDKLLSFLKHNFGIDPVEPNLPLISSGLVDSLKFVELLHELERSYGISIDPRDVGVDNFDTPHQILAFVSAAK